MLGTLISLSIRHRILVVFASVLLAALGVYNFTRLPIDAVPDITNVQVQINTSVPSLSPTEIEQRVTYPIEVSMSGLPGLDELRSISRYGLSQVTVVFKDDTDLYLARQLVSERLQIAKGSLPAGLAEPAMSPISTGLGEVYMWSVEAEPGAKKPDGSDYNLMDLRTIQDWVIRPQLLTVPGVAEVNSIGGYAKQFHITPQPARLLSLGLSFQDIAEALEQNNSFASGGYIEHRSEQYLVKMNGLVSSIEEIGSIPLATRDGIPILINDVAEVSLGKELRTGAATFNGEESVIGTAMMLIGENSRTVSRNVHEAVFQINKTLPDGVVARTVYNRDATGRRYNCDGSKQSRRRSHPRHCRLVSHSRQSQSCSLCRSLDSALYAVCCHRHGEQQNKRQSAEPRGN